MSAPAHGNSAGVSSIELFLDRVFVFVITQVTPGAGVRAFPSFRRRATSRRLAFKGEGRAARRFSAWSPFDLGASTEKAGDRRTEFPIFHGTD
jgi:hypothetical protein